VLISRSTLRGYAGTVPSFCWSAGVNVTWCYGFVKCRLEVAVVRSEDDQADVRLAIIRTIARAHNTSTPFSSLPVQTACHGDLSWDGHRSSLNQCLRDDVSVEGPDVAMASSDADNNL
jgi:hypothetical protein